MTETEAQRQKEIQQAEELLFAGPQALGFAKGLFLGRFVSDWIMPYPRIPAAQQIELDKSLAEVRQFLDEDLDPTAIDRQADIPRAVIDGLGRVGVLGMTAPKEFGGHGFSQMANCRILEEIGRRCASTSVFVNAHHSIGIRALLLFGTHAQKQTWLPRLVTGEQLAALRRTLGSDRSGIRYEFLGAIVPNGDAGDLPVLGGLDAVPRILREHDVHELIVTDGGFGERDLLELVEEAHRFGAKVKIAPRTTELLLQRAEYIPGEGAPLFELRPPALAGSEWALKRGFDLVVSSIVIVAGLPLWLAVAGAVKLSSRGPVFYRDRRIGLSERPFGMMKFRTMYANAAARQGALEADNEASGPLFKIKDDPRVTPVGRFLRRYSLDEMPQVLNVLWGEMSLVGPRPLPIRDYEQLLPWHRKRYLVLPGMTGLWQVSGRIDLSFDDLVRLDFYYIENWSVWLDITILARTLPAVLARRGAY